MTRELELRELTKNDLQLDDDMLDHLLIHLKLKLSEYVTDTPILRLLKHDEYVRHLANNFISELKK